MKRAVILIILGGVLAALIGGVLLLTHRPFASKEQARAADPGKVSISRFDKALLKSMRVRTASHTLELHKSGEEWGVDYPHPIELNSMAVDDLAYSFAGLYSEVIVEENPQDLARYGLEPPVATAAYELLDGSKREFYLGDKTSTGNTYYLMAQDDPMLYAVWMNHGLHFQYELADIRSKKLPVINTNEISYLEIARRDGVVLEASHRDSVPSGEGEFAMTSLFLTQPYSPSRPVSMDRWPEYTKTISTLEISRFIDDDPQDLSRYGLDPPAIELHMRDAQNSLELKFGDKTGNLVYFQKGADRAVYAMEKDRLDFLDVKPFFLMDKFAFIVSIDNVERITIEAPETEHTLSMTRKTEKKQQGDKVEEEVITTYSLDGSEVEEDAFKDAYQALIALFLEAEYSPAVPEHPEVRLVYSMNKGSIPEYVISFVPFDVDFYAVFKNGATGFLISRIQIEKMLAALDKFVEESG